MICRKGKISSKKKEEYVGSCTLIVPSLFRMSCKGMALIVLHLRKKVADIVIVLRNMSSLYRLLFLRFN